MSKGAYKLTYFNGRGRGEIARLLFAAKGVKYNDNRIASDDWAALKPKTPLGTLPILEVDGKSLSQSMAINRYLAKKFGLYGKNEWDEAMINEVCDSAVDFLSNVVKMMFGSDESKAAAAKEMKEDIAPKYLTIMEKKLVDNKTGFLTGKELTLADIALYQSLEGVSRQMPEVLEKFPKIKENRKKVETSKGIKEWIASRPDTSF